MIAQDLNEVPSDLRVYNILTYKEDGSDFEVFKDMIHAALSEIFGSNPKVDSPFFDHIENSGGRVRDFKISFFSDENEIAGGKITLPLKEFLDPKPSKTLDDYFIRNQIIPRDSGYDQSELDDYHEKLRQWAKEMAVLVPKAWESDRTRALALNLDLYCENSSDVQADDVHIEIEFFGDVEIFKEVPDKINLPVKPKAPKHIHEKQMNVLTGMLGINSSLSRMFRESSHTLVKDFPIIPNQQYNGCWVEENVVTYRAPKIRQKSKFSNWESFYIIPKENFNSAYAIVEIRAQNCRGIQKIQLPIIFEPINAIENNLERGDV